VIVEATSLSTPISSNDCVSVLIGAGKWLIYCTNGTDAVKRAKIIKTLFYGTNGTDPKILTFTGVTAIKTSHANDIGKQAYLSSISYYPLPIQEPRGVLYWNICRYHNKFKL
jgi:hypothetical protein